MIIRFLLPNGDVVTSPYEIQMYERKSSMFQYLLMLKSLEFVDKFQEDVQRVRKENGLPKEGLGEEHIKYFNKFTSNALNFPKRFSESESKYERLYVHLANTKPSEYGIENLYEAFRNATAIADIYVLGIVQVPLINFPDIWWKVQNKGSMPIAEIHISSSVEITHLRKFIDTHYKQEIKPALEKEETSFRLDEETLRVLHLRDNEKRSFSQIADIMNKEYKKNWIYSDMSSRYHKKKRALNSKY